MRDHSRPSLSARTRTAVNTELANCVAERPEAVDQATRRALESFKALLQERYGAQLRGVYLFGSRARGDHRADSDADVGVFLDQVSDPLGEQLSLIEQGYGILLETGINIQPWVFESASLSDPGQYRASHLVRSICQEGLRL